MKKILTLLLLLIYLNSEAQTIVDSLSNLSFTLKDTISDKLADLVTNKSLYVKSLDKQVEASKYEWQRSKTFWTNSLTASFNLNEGNIQSKNDSALGNFFFPRYNFNLSLPMGLIFSRPKETKRAKALFEETMIQRDITKQQLRQNIKNSYQNYLTNKYLLALQDAVLQDEGLLLSQVQAKFESNQTGLENFINSTKRYNGELVRKLTLLRDVNNSKTILENYIGMPLEDALRAINVSPN